MSITMRAHTGGRLTRPPMPGISRKTAPHAGQRHTPRRPICAMAHPSFGHLHAFGVSSVTTGPSQCPDILA